MMLTFQGGIYLLHMDRPEASLQFEGGFSYVPFRAGRYITSGVAGNFGLKLTCYCTSPRIGNFLALRVLGFQANDADGASSLVRHYGLGFGYIFKRKHAKIEFDLLNIYHSFNKEGYSISWGMRYIFW